jgi:hypothetical protein
VPSFATLNEPMRDPFELKTPTSHASISNSHWMSLEQE